MLLFLTGCESKEEKVKSEYIAIKSNLLSANNYVEELPVDIVVFIDRIGEEKIQYKVVFENPKENMHKIKAMVVHNYNDLDVFPSVGLFDETKELIVSSDDSSKFELIDTIDSVKDIDKLNLKLKVWVEYLNEDGEKKNIYYRT